MIEKSIVSNELSEIWVQIVECEKSLDYLRQNTITKGTEISAFIKKNLTGKDIQNFLSMHSIYSKDEEIILFISQWDWDGDGKLSENDFANWIEIEDLETISNQTIAEMLYTEIKFLKDCEERKYKVNMLEGFKILETFEMFTKNGLNITAADIIELICDSIEKDDLAYVFKGIRRVTKGINDYISYFEFADFFLYNRAYFFLNSCYPDGESNPLSMNYAVLKNQIEGSRIND